MFTSFGILFAILIAHIIVTCALSSEILDLKKRVDSLEQSLEVTDDLLESLYYRFNKEDLQKKSKSFIDLMEDLIGIKNKKK